MRESPLDVVDHTGRICVMGLEGLEAVGRSWGVEHVMPEMTFDEACAYDIFVRGSATAEPCLATCRGTLSRALDSRRAAGGPSEGARPHGRCDGGWEGPHPEAYSCVVSPPST